ncbi:MAG: type ISP restriction/modification enzyme, partial [Armatimonadota bacterium]
VGLVTSRQQKTDGFHHVLVHKIIVESSYVSNKTSEIGYSFPLYTYTVDSGNLLEDQTIRTPNLNKEILTKISYHLKLDFSDANQDITQSRKDIDDNTFAPIDILDYIYALLHCPSYREKYKEFLKTDFPRVPYPDDKDMFWKLVELGSKLRKLHLMEHPILDNKTITFPISGNNCIEKIEYKDMKVYINSNQYFGNVPKTAWEFYIGGYQPAQKWLKDRKTRTLTFDDITHYQKIIIALTETDKVMKEIDELYGKKV